MIVAMRARLDLVGAAAAGLFGLAVAFTPPVSSGAVPTSLPTFVAVTPSGKMALYSSLTGARVKTLATLPSNAFTDNDLAYAPDGSSVYFTLIPPRRKRAFSLRLMRLDVKTGRQSFVADGAQPALSNDAKQLAYGAFPQGLAVRDLATGGTRTIALTQLGKSAELLNASIRWLADGSDVAIVPSAAAWDLMGTPPKLRWCGTSQSRPVVVFVHVPSPPAPLTAVCVHLAGPALGGLVVLGGSPTFPHAVLIATDVGDKTIVEKVTQTGMVTPMLNIPDSLPQSFDPSGTHLLYVAGHKPPLLTEATITNGKLTSGPWHESANLGALAW
jgi:hypothetical protein